MCTRVVRLSQKNKLQASNKIMPPTALSPQEATQAAQEDTTMQGQDNMPQPPLSGNGWCISGHSARNPWLCAAIIADTETSDMWYLFMDDVASLVRGECIHGELPAVSSDMQAWFESVSVPLACLSAQQGIVSRQLPWFSPWMQLQLPDDHPAAATMENKVVALNMCQVETLHVSCMTRHNFYVVAALHTRMRLVCRCISSMTPQQVMQLAVLCSGQRFLGPFVHDDMSSRGHAPCADLTQSVFHAFPQLRKQPRWNVLILHGAITSVQCLLEDCAPMTPASDRGTPQLWRVDFWMNNSRQLSNVIVPSCAQTQEDLFTEILC